MRYESEVRKKTPKSKLRKFDLDEVARDVTGRRAVRGVSLPSSAASLRDSGRLTSSAETRRLRVAGSGGRHMVCHSARPSAKSAERRPTIRTPQMPASRFGIHLSLEPPSEVRKNPCSHHRGEAYVGFGPVLPRLRGSRARHLRSRRR